MVDFSAWCLKAKRTKNVTSKVFGDLQGDKKDMTKWFYWRIYKNEIYDRVISDKYT